MKLTELHEALVSNGVVTFGRPYFSKLVGKGKIPYTGNGMKKIFDYDEVVKALVGGVERPSSSVVDTKSKTMPDGTSFKQLNEDGTEKTVNSTKIFLQEYQGKIAQQKFDIEDNLLVYREDVENTGFELARIIREQLLVIPEKTVIVICIVLVI